MASRFATPLHCRHIAAFNGLLLDWSPPVALWINPPCHLLPQVLEKLRVSRSRGILVYPFMFSRSAAAFSLPLPPAASASLRQTAPPRHRRTFRPPRGATAGSGLRLCVNDGLLQACVLLATQGDNSRIRWSVSQEWQHVLSSDIKTYNKKLLGSSPALLQEVALPTNFMLRNVSTLAPGFEAGVRLLQGDRRPSTVKSYDQK